MCQMRKLQRSKRKHFLAKVDHARLALIRCAQLYPKCQRDHLTRDICSPLSARDFGSLLCSGKKAQKKASRARTQPGALTANSFAPEKRRLVPCDRWTPKAATID